MPHNASPASSATPSPASPRLLSLDALRGFDMFWIVGAEGLVHALDKISDTGIVRALANQLRHKEWEGFAFYDLIFPMFVFIVGVSIVFSLGRILEQESKLAAYQRILRRSILLFALGLWYYGGASNEWPNIRVMGVLNRIALCYLFAGLVFCHFKTRGIIGVSAGLLLGYWALMTFVPVPGVGAGSFAPGANLANHIDKLYLPGKRYDGDWDPEGLLSTLPAIATCLLGVLAGFLLKNDKVAPSQKAACLIGGGIVGALIGFLWGLHFPVIKKIWTSSYVLVAGGYSCVLLGLFYQVIEVWKFQKWAVPFVWIGMNPITIYVLDNVVNFERLATRFAGGNIKNFFDAAVTKGFGDLVIQMVGLGMCFLVVRFLYQRRIFLRL
jgi:predicted acyltransferase